MKQFIEFLYRVGTDKYIHYIACLLITLFVFAIGTACGLGNWVVAPAIVLALGAGFFKEKYDAKHGGIFDNYDIVADFFGMFTAVVLIAIMLIK